MHCSGSSQSITPRFAAVVEVSSLSLHYKVLLSRAFILLLSLLLLLTGERVSVRSVGATTVQIAPTLWDEQWGQAKVA